METSLPQSAAPLFERVKDALLRRRAGRRMQRRGRRRPKARPPRVVRLAGRALVLFVAVTALPVLALRWVPALTSSFVLQARVFGEEAVHHRWIPGRDIDPDLALAVVASEDQRFPIHHGFDFEEIRNALSEEGRQRGASTLSQQVAKNLFLWQGGGWFRKGIEAWFTVLIEALWPKGRILEVYLNVAEFGPGVYGAAEASERFYGTSASALSRTQAAQLAAVLPSPRRMSAARPSDYVRRRTREIERQMRALGGTAYLEGVWSVE